MVFKARMAGIPGDGYGRKIILLRAEVSSLSERVEIQVLVVVHAGGVYSDGQSVHRLPIQSGIAGHAPVVGHVQSLDKRITDRGVFADGLIQERGVVRGGRIELGGNSVGDNPSPSNASTWVTRARIGQQAVLDAVANTEQREPSILRPITEATLNVVNRETLRRGSHISSKGFVRHCP